MFLLAVLKIRCFHVFSIARFCYRRLGFHHVQSISISIKMVSIIQSDRRPTTRWQRGLHLLQHLQVELLEADVVAYSAAINTCEKAGRWQEAVEVLQWLLEGHTQPNVIACTSLISACSGEGHWEQALALFNSMTSREVCPNVISYNTTISACEKAAQWQHALQLAAVGQDTRRDTRCHFIQHHHQCMCQGWCMGACDISVAGNWHAEAWTYTDLPQCRHQRFRESYSMAAVLAATGPSWELRIASERHHVQLRNECMCTSWWMGASGTDAGTDHLQIPPAECALLQRSHQCLWKSKRGSGCTRFVATSRSNICAARYHHVQCRYQCLRKSSRLAGSVCFAASSAAKAAFMGSECHHLQCHWAVVLTLVQVPFDWCGLMRYDAVGRHVFYRLTRVSPARISWKPYV